MIGIFTSDWQCWDKPTDYRSDEPCWWKAMQRPIDEIKALQTKHNCPIVHGGDVLDGWKGTPELINWCLRHFPIMYSVAGNHDAPNHRIEDIEKSAYWTLVEAGRLIHLKASSPHPLNGMMLHGFSFGEKIKSIASHPIDAFNVAVIHQYVWRKGHGYQGAPEDKRVGEWERRLGNFQFAFFGDNHHRFDYKGRDTHIVNTGCIMRRRRDEAKYTPSVALLWSDGEVSWKKLDCSRDVYKEKEEVVEVSGASIDPDELIASLKGLQQQTKIDFNATVSEIMLSLNVGKEVRAKVTEALESGEK